MLSIFRYTLLTAIRDKMAAALLALIVGCFFLSSFLGQTSLVEQAHMATSYFAFIARIVVVLSLALFVCVHIGKLCEHREIDMFLSKPVSRMQFAISCWLSYLAIGVCNVIIINLLMLTLHTFSFGATAYWSVTVLCELILIIGFAILSTLILQSAVGALLSTIAFYVISRLLGFFLISSHQSEQGGFFGILNDLLMMIASLMPRLDQFGQTEWLIYGIDTVDQWWLVPLQTLIYMFVIALMMRLDLNKKQF